MSLVFRLRCAEFLFDQAWSLPLPPPCTMVELKIRKLRAEIMFDAWIKLNQFDGVVWC